MEEEDKKKFLIQALKKWFVGCIASVFEHGFVAKQIIVFRSTNENTGKTRFTHTLLPPHLSIYKTYETNIARQDAELALASNLIIHFDEIDQFLLCSENCS